MNDGVPFNESGYRLPLTDEELAGECVITVFRAGGKGGQHVNKTDSAVRVRHLPSGITVTCQRERSQHLNKKFCFQRLRLRVTDMLEVKKARVSTKVPRSIREKRRTHKKILSQKKNARAPVRFDD